MSEMSFSMQGWETNCLVKAFGPIHDCSFCDALAEMVMIAFKKSPAEVCVAQECSDDKKESKVGIRSCA
jgi:hypothetical protein